MSSRRIATLGAALALLSITATAWAAPRIGAHDVATLFFISKSDDRNRVDYGVHLDARCEPSGDSPLYAYWRRFEPGQNPFGGLNAMDRRAYGIVRQQVRVREPNGSWIEFRVRALPERRLLALVQRTGSGCVGSVRTTIDGAEATLRDVHIELDGPMRVREVTVRGARVEGGAEVIERMRP